MTASLLPDRPLLTTAEAAFHLHCTQQHIRNLERSGALEGRRLGRKLLIPRREVLRLAGERSSDFAHEEDVSSPPDAAQASLKDLRRAWEEFGRLLDRLEAGIG